MVFERTLPDLIRGIRSNKKNEQKFINQCLDEIRKEITSNDVDIKANAVSKLCYVSVAGSCGVTRGTRACPGRRFAGTVVNVVPVGLLSGGTGRLPPREMASVSP
jgi:hypothetical protein